MKKKLNSFICVGGVLAVLLTLLFLVGLFWTPYPPDEMHAMAKFQAPSAQYLLGTDNLGRDVLSRIMDGMGTSFFIAICVVLIGCFFGIVIGSLCGYYGGIADAILTRLCDTITAFPAMLLALIVISITGGGQYNIILVLGILFIPSFARIVRTEYARVRDLNYIQSARLMGVSTFRIMYVHILPNTIPVLLPAVTIGFNNAILSEASMSFLGIGITPPQASLGTMLKDSQSYLRNAPWFALCTGCAIVLIILSFSLLSEGIQQRNRSRKI
ncbi:MAG: ABC transporter permease [Oscillospiraceae bacterium]|nr:ABC transporter permease [Oscillospiraceae bacterium]